MSDGHVRLSDFRSARALMDAALASAEDAESIRRQLAQMARREGVRAQTYEPRGRSGHRADAMAVVDARLDRERVLSERLLTDYEVIDLATAVIYGADGHGGVMRSDGALAADALWWRYLDGATWGKVARMVGMGVTWCQSAVATALGGIDERGMEATAGVPRGWHPDVDREW